MRRRSLLNMAAGMLLIGSTLFAFADSRASNTFECADGTYEYNLANVVKVQNGYQVSISGAGLGPMELKTSAGTLKLAPGWELVPALYLPFKPESCIFDTTPNAMKIACSEDALTFYVGTTGDPDSDLATVKVRSAKFAMQSDGQPAKLTLYGARNGRSSDVQTLTIPVDKAFCKDYVQFSVRFPPSIKGQAITTQGL